MARRRYREKIPPLDHESAVEDWQQNAVHNDDSNYEFLRSVKFRDYGFHPDELASELHERAFQIVDCTRCANCCQTMTVKLDQPDIDHLAQHLKMTSAEFVEKFLEPGEEQGSSVIRRKPCPFLGEDNRCTVYDVRPAVCREYPHTDKEQFASRSMVHANNALKCPAVFWIVERMRRRASG